MFFFLLFFFAITANGRVNAGVCLTDKLLFLSLPGPSAFFWITEDEPGPL